MSAQDQQPKEHEERIVDKLDEHRDELEKLADSETSFASRAQSALEWLDDHQEDDDAE